MSSELKIHWNFETHLLKNLFKQTEINHFRSHAHMNFWSKLEKKNSMTKNHQVLKCIWVYVYKFMKKKMLTKCKMWLVVQENQQKLISADIYAIILVICFFCVFIIMIIWFNLKLTQYNIINVFMHVNLNEIVFMKMSDRYWKNNHILKLNKTLYELWKFSIL